MLNMSRERTTIIIGKTGTGKTTKALELFDGEPIVKYANEYDIDDNFSIPLDKGILIEECHYKPNINMIVRTLIEYRGKVVLTSLNQKDVPKQIMDKCKIKRAGTKNYAFEKMKQNGCSNIETMIDEPNLSIFELVAAYKKSGDRDKIARLLKHNRPFDEQILSWLVSTVGVNKIGFLDAKVKRRWGSAYFYELLAYAHEGGTSGRLDIPRRRAKDKRPYVCKKIGLKESDWYLLNQLKQNKEFQRSMKKRLNKIERTMVGLNPTKESLPKRNTQLTLGDF